LENKERPSTRLLLATVSSLSLSKLWGSIRLAAAS